jgi:hypothetical protein
MEKERLEREMPGELVAAALESFGEDATAERINEIREQMIAAGSADVTSASLAAQVGAARHVLAEKKALVAEVSQPPKEKTFEVGGVKFSAVRTMQPRPHWRLRIEESGEIFEPGTGGISTESAPKMQADVEELFRRMSKGDPVDFRARLNLPEAGSPDTVALAGAFQAVYYTGKRMPEKTAQLEACWGNAAVDAIKRHGEGGISHEGGGSTAEECVLAGALEVIRNAVDGGEPYRSQALRGPEFKAAHAAAGRFAPDWRKCVESYEKTYAEVKQAASTDLSI